MKKIQDAPSLQCWPSYNNSLEILSIIVIRTYNLQLTSLTPLDPHNEVGHRKGVLCTLICEFVSLRRSLTSFSQVLGKPRSLNTSLMCTQEMLQKKMRCDTEFWILDSGEPELPFNVRWDAKADAGFLKH